MSVATSVVRSVVGVGAAINRSLFFTWDQTAPKFDSSLEKSDETLN